MLHLIDFVTCSNSFYNRGLGSISHLRKTALEEEDIPLSEIK